MAKDLDTGGSIDLRVPGRAKGAPWLGMHQDWEWGQFSTEKLPGIPWALLAPVNLEQGALRAPQLWGRATATPGVTLGLEGALCATTTPRALLRKSQGH